MNRLDLPDLSGRTILIVDDNDDALDMLGTFLRACGAHVLASCSAIGALDSIESHPHIDAVITDLSMPDMDGYAVATLLKADPKTAGIPIIMVTAHTGRGARVVGLHTGAEDYLTKPVDAPELLLKIRNLLRLSGGMEPAARLHA